MDARLKVRLARERGFQLLMELDLRKLEAETALRMRQIELQADSGSPGADRLPMLGSAGSFDVSKNIPLGPVFLESQVET